MSLGGQYKEKGNPTMKAETEMMQARLKDFHQPPEDRRSKDQILPYRLAKTLT